MSNQFTQCTNYFHKDQHFFYLSQHDNNHYCNVTGCNCKQFSQNNNKTFKFIYRSHVLYKTGEP